MKSLCMREDELHLMVMEAWTSSVKLRALPCMKPAALHMQRAELVLLSYLVPLLCWWGKENHRRSSLFVQ